MEADQALTELEQLIKELKHEYEQFFSGEIRIEPQKQRKVIHARIRNLNRMHLTNTGMKFRFHSLEASFNAFQRLWDRILHEIELGTYQPHKFKADYHVGKVDKKTGEVIESELHKKKTEPETKALRPLQDYKLLYTDFLQARSQTGEPGKISYESFKKSIEAQIPVLQKKIGGKIKFKVAVEEGKVKVKGVRV